MYGVSSTILPWGRDILPRGINIHPIYSHRWEFVPGAAITENEGDISPQILTEGGWGMLHPPMFWLVTLTSDVFTGRWRQLEGQRVTLIQYFFHTSVELALE